MDNVDWFPYFLQPEKLHADFAPESHAQRWATAEERRSAGDRVLRGLLSANNFREYVMSAYPELDETQPGKYPGPTPPSTPLSPMSGGPAQQGPVRRIGQCARFAVSEDGLPAEQLSVVLKANGLPELNARQECFLGIADRLTELVGFEVEEIETSVHAAIRFIYYLHLLESSRSDENQFQYRRWVVRSAYREEEAGLSIEVEADPAMDATCVQIQAHIGLLDESDEQARQLKFKTTYDLGRLALAQSRFNRALEMFRECQRINPEKSKPDRFGLVGRRAKPSIDEYVTACTTIVQSLQMECAETPTGQFGTRSISGRHSQIAMLIDEKEYDRAMQECLLSALSSMDDGLEPDGCSWMTSIHPQLLQYCGLLKPPDVAAASRLLAGTAKEWVASRSASGRFSAEEVEELERRAAAIVMFITGTSEAVQPDRGAEAPKSDAGSDVEMDGCTRMTIAQGLVHGQEQLALDTSKAPLAMLQLAYSYLAGLRLLEKERYQKAYVWFSRGRDMAANFPAAQQSAGPVMAQHAEKEKALKAALETQVHVHARLADVCHQIDAGGDINDLFEDIEAILEAQAPIRFEFLEHLVAVCLRHDNRRVFAELVRAIGTNQKLFQQLPDIHLSLLQAVSLLVVIRDVLLEAGIDVAQVVSGEIESSDLPVFTPEQLAKLQGPISEVASLLLKIPVGGKKGVGLDLRTVLSCIPQPGSKHENEIERFCRLWGDPASLTLLGAMLAEILQMGRAVVGPPALCTLVGRLIHTPASTTPSDGAQQEAAGSVAAELVDSTTEKGRKGVRQLQDIALIVFKSAARVMPRSASLWLYFSAAAAVGERFEDQFMPLFLEYLAVYTEGFSPGLLDECIGQAWFQQRLPTMVRSLTGLGMSGAAAVLHQCAADVDYSACIPLVVQAFERGEIDQRVAEFFWDGNIIEYGQHLSKLSDSNIQFAVPSSELSASRSLVLSAYFIWLSGVVSIK